MTQRTIDLLVKIAIEIVDWINILLKEKRSLITMTATELQKRNEKSDHLRVLQTDSGQFFVESGEGKILYSVTINDAGDTCTCGDFAKNIKRDPDFKCKHILAVFNAVPKREVEGAVFLEKHMPKLDERWITKIEGKEFVKYPGLLDLAHQHGLSSIEVDIVQMPTKPTMEILLCAGQRSCRRSAKPIQISEMPIPAIVPAKWPSIYYGWPAHDPLPGRFDPIPTWG